MVSIKVRHATVVLRHLLCLLQKSYHSEKSGNPRLKHVCVCVYIYVQ